MRWYHSTKTAKIFWVTLDVAMHGAAFYIYMNKTNNNDHEPMLFAPNFNNASS